MEKPNIFDVFKEMNQEDTANGTKSLVVSAYFEGGQLHTVKKGGVIRMGVAAEQFMEVAGNDRIPLLLLIDKKIYNEKMGE